MDPDALAPEITPPTGRARLRIYATPDTGTLPVVFLHAAVCDSRMWHHEFAGLGKTRRVVAYDRRGFGRTPSVGEPWSNADDLIAVLDTLKIDRAILVGCSQGGRITLDAGIAHPDRVAAMVAVCGAIGGAPWSPTTDPTLLALEKEYEAIEEKGDVEARIRIAARYWLDGPLAEEGRVQGPVRQLFHDMMARSLVAPEKGGLMATPDTAWAALPDVKMPVMTVWGPLDEPTVTQWMKLVKDRVPGAVGFEVPGTAHLPNLERPDLFGPRLAAFVDSVR